MIVIGRRSAGRERGKHGGKGGRFDDMPMLRALFAACPRLVHLDLACFTRSTMVGRLHIYYQTHTHTLVTRQTHTHSPKSEGRPLLKMTPRIPIKHF